MLYIVEWLESDAESESAEHVDLPLVVNATRNALHGLEPGKLPENPLPSRVFLVRPPNGAFNVTPSIVHSPEACQGNIGMAMCISPSSQGLDLHASRNLARATLFSVTHRSLLGSWRRRSDMIWKPQSSTTSRWLVLSEPLHGSRKDKLDTCSC